METLDWIVVAAYGLLMLVLGAVFSRRASKGVDEFFASGRGLAWWAAGTSMIATTFAADTPLFVTGIVRKSGIWANWMWWGFLASHLAVAFFFVRWWKRSGVLTEVELTELRYSGRSAAVLRGVKAVLWGGVYNVYVAGALPVLAMAKIAGAVTGADMSDPRWRMLSIGSVTAIALGYSAAAGLWGVVVTDLVQLAVAFVGAVVLCVIALNAVGGFEGLMASTAVQERVAYLPAWPDGDWFGSDLAFVASFFVVQWWAFKNADGGGIMVQRMVASRDERHAVVGALWFAAGHYVLRAWPWILAALASIVLMPHLADPEMAYPAMALAYLPPVLKGLVVASFAAAFMSTMDTHINWGASYVVNDLYRRFWRPKAPDAHYLRVSRWASLAIAAGAMGVAYFSESLEQAFVSILMVTAGIGTVLLGRWLWWRTNAWSEIAAMAGSLATALTAGPLGLTSRLGALLYIALATTALWVAVTLVTRPVSPDKLVAFYRRVRPPRWGWRPVAEMTEELVSEEESFASRVLLWIVGVVSLAGLNLAGVTLLQGATAEGIGLVGLSLALASMVLRRVTGKGVFHRIGGTTLVGCAFAMTMLGWFGLESLGALLAGLALVGEQSLPSMTVADEPKEPTLFGSNPPERRNGGE
jgi:SSS family solute:Na+ symporter